MTTQQMLRRPRFGAVASRLGTIAQMLRDEGWAVTLSVDTVAGTAGITIELEPLPRPVLRLVDAGCDEGDPD